jgi:hypothetical protein
VYINKYSTPLPPLEYSMYNNVPTLYRHWCTIPGHRPTRVNQSVMITHNELYEKPILSFHYAPIVIPFDKPVGLSVGLFGSDFFSFRPLIHRALLQRGLRFAWSHPSSTITAGACCRGLIPLRYPGMPTSQANIMHDFDHLLVLFHASVLGIVSLYL